VGQELKIIQDFYDLMLWTMNHTSRQVGRVEPGNGEAKRHGARHRINEDGADDTMRTGEEPTR
jgi:hypothetical protein